MALRSPSDDTELDMSDKGTLRDMNPTELQSMADIESGLVPAALVAAARAYAADSRAENTKRAYASDLKTFRAWCESLALEDLPAAPSTVALYLTHLAQSGRKVATIERSLAAISVVHKISGMASPRGDARVMEVLGGIRRRLGTAQARKSPVMVEMLRGMVSTLPPGLRGTRDRALLVFGFALGFRRSEIVSLDVADLVFGRDGVAVTLRRSKTDQEGAGREIAVFNGSFPETCPVRAIQAWLTAAGIEVGPVFRRISRHGRIGSKQLGAKTVAHVVQTAAKALGLDARKFGGHSLRSGLVSSALAAGKSERSVRKQTGHKPGLTFEKYIRDFELWQGSSNATVGIGL